jgi:N-formylglutamate amidohydrolase
MTDAYTDELFALPHDVAIQVRFPVSRLVVDPERFVDDSQEVMASKGMGVIYMRTADGRPLREELASSEPAKLVSQYYRPHHDRLTASVESCLGNHGRCLIIDAHSFPALPLPYELDQTPERPDICIGTDSVHTPDWLAREAKILAEAQGWSVKFNRPFAGALVPIAYYGRDSDRVFSVMIEVRRDLYMDELSGQRSPTFEKVQTGIRQMCVGLVERLKCSST